MGSGRMDDSFKWVVKFALVCVKLWFLFFSGTEGEGDRTEPCLRPLLFLVLVREALIGGLSGDECSEDVERTSLFVGFMDRTLLDSEEFLRLSEATAPVSFLRAVVMFLVFVLLLAVSCFVSGSESDADI